MRLFPLPQPVPRPAEYNRAQQAGVLSSYEIAAEQLVWRLGAVDRIRLLRERE